MPALDGTGPAGRGPMTGRGMGCCARVVEPGTPAAGPGCGMGFGRGRGSWGRGGGRGWWSRLQGRALAGWQPAAAEWPRWRGAAACAGPTQAQELEALKEQAEYVEKTLGNLRRRIEELQATPDAK